VVGGRVVVGALELVGSVGVVTVCVAAVEGVAGRPEHVIDW